MHVIRAEATRNPQAIFDSFSAAQLYGLNVSWRNMGQLNLMTERKLVSWHVDAAEDPIWLRDVRGLWDDASSQRIYSIDGIRVVSPQIAVCTCLLKTRLPDGLAVADSLLRATGITREDLMGAVERHGAHRHGIGVARLCASLADGRAESGGESVARGRFVEEGYELPDLQRSMLDRVDSRTSYRVDFFWERDGAGIIGELDGMIKYTDESILRGEDPVSVLVDERQRESHLTLQGYPVVRLLARRLYEPGYVSRLLDAAGVTRVGSPI